MTATFGKLQGQTLELRDGLNILEAPNETGKSTWCAFLLAHALRHQQPGAGSGRLYCGQKPLRPLVRRRHVAGGWTVRPGAGS